MYKQHFIDLYDYTDWANRRTWACVMKLSQADYEKHLTYSIGSILVQCVHTMAVERWWLHFLATGEFDFSEDEDDKLELYKDRAKLRARWDEITAINKAYVASLTVDELQRLVRPEFWPEPEPGITVAQALIQVANHSTDHRSQIMAMLHQFGVDGVEHDFLGYLHRNVD